MEFTEVLAADAAVWPLIVEYFGHGTVALISTGGSLTGVVGTPGAAAPPMAIQVAGVDTGGNIRRALVDQFGRSIDATIDLVSRQHVADVQIIQYGYAASAPDPYRWSLVAFTGGTAAYNATTGEYELSVTADAGSTSIMIHNQIAYYRIYCQYGATFSGSRQNSANNNQRIEWGVTSGIATSATSLQAADAIGFCDETGIFGIFFRSSILGAYPGNTTSTPRDQWNVDRLDGSGDAFNPSGYNITPAEMRLLLWDVRFVWLGAFGIEWRIGERIVHRVRFDEVPYLLSAPFARIPHMRLYVYAHNSGASAPNSFHFNCGGIHTNGGGEPIPTPGASSRTTPVPITAAAGAVPLFALRLAATFGGLTNMRRIIIEEISFRVTNQDFRIDAWLGRETDFAFAGAAFGAPPNSPRSAAQRDIASTAVTIGAGATILGGTTISNAAVTGSFDLRKFFGELKASIGVNGDGVLDVFLLTATALGGVNGTASLQSIQWTELG